MRGDATLFTRNDEVEAQWRICDPIVERLGSRRRAAAAVRSRLAGSGGGRRAAARRRPLARDLMLAPQRRAVWSARRARRPTRSKRRCAALLAERHAETRELRPRARAEHDRRRRREWSGEIANRLRGVGRYHASRLLVLAFEPRRERLDARATSPPTPTRARRARAAARDRHRRARRSAPRRPRHDRRPARRHRPADAAVVAARPPRGGRRAARAWRRRAARLDRAARPARRRSTARVRAVASGLRRRSRVAALDALARARGGVFDPPRCARELHTINAVTVRHHPDSRSRRCCSSAGWPRAWLVARPRSSRRERRRSTAARTPRRRTSR